MTTIRVKSYERRKPSDKYSAVKASMTENLLGFVLHRQCVEALERKLSEPLDEIDMPEDMRTRIQETY